MNRKANILQFRQESGLPENELEDLLSRIDDPENEAPGFLFKNLDGLDPDFFQDDEGERLIFLEDSYALIDGGDDGVIAFVVARATASLSALLANGDGANPATCAKDGNMPRVRGVEVLLSGDIGISRRSDLPKLGIQTRAGSLQLDARWELMTPKPGKGPYATEIWIWRQGGIRLETTLPVRRTPKGKAKCLFTPFKPDGSEK